MEFIIFLGIAFWCFGGTISNNQQKPVVNYVLMNIKMDDCMQLLEVDAYLDSDTYEADKKVKLDLGDSQDTWFDDFGRSLNLGRLPSCFRSMQLSYSYVTLIQSNSTQNETMNCE